MSKQDLSPSVVLGLPIPLEDASWRVWSGPVHLLAARYATKLQESGASVMMLPVAASGFHDIKRQAHELVARLDGLVLAGGVDVEPARYGAEPHERSGPFDEARDAWEMALCEAAIAEGVPVFAICRGMQLLNVLLGGTLIQHLPDVVGSDMHNPSRDAFGTHRVMTEEASWVRSAIGEYADVSTYHHQAAENIGKGLSISARAEDGTVEAVEDMSRNLIGLQWHPEVGDDLRVFTKFVALCQEHRESEERVES